MKTNSKLYKRVLAIALAVCMLCSVLVTGIGVGLKAKAAVSSVDVKMYADAAGWWPQVRPEETVTTNGVKTISGILDSGSGFEQCQLEIFYGADDGITVSDVALTIGGANVEIGDWYDSAAGKHTYYIVDKTAYADTAWSGEEVKFTYTIAGIEEAEETPAESDTDTSGTDTPDDSEESSNTAFFSYQDCGNWWSTVSKNVEFGGSGKYVFKVYDAAAWNGGISGEMNAYLTLLDFNTALKDAGYTVNDVKADITIEMDGVEVGHKAYVFEKDNGADIEICINNCWVSKDVTSTWNDSCVFTIDITVPDEFGTNGGCDLVLSGSAPVEEDKEIIEDSAGAKKESGYVHDKGAIFVYTGKTYDIHDFQFYGYAFFRMHQLNGEWGAWYDDYAALRGQGFYIKYWDDYKGIGYPAVQLSWDTDRAWYFSLFLRSSDYLINLDYNLNNGDGFWRGPAERIEESGETYLDGGNKWYYFGEGSYEAADDTTDTATQNPVPTTEGAINVTGDGEYYSFLAIGADNNKDDWYYSWSGVQKAEEEDDNNKLPVAGLTVNAVNAKIGEQFTIGLETETPVAYTWYVSPTIIVGADKTAVDAEVVAVRIDGVDVTDTIDFAADEKTWWYEDTGIYNKANNDNKDVAARLAGGYNEWGTKYIAESPAGYTSIEYDIIINSIA